MGRPPCGSDNRRGPRDGLRRSGPREVVSLADAVRLVFNELTVQVGDVYAVVIPEIGKTFVSSSREAAEKAADEYIHALTERVMGKKADEEICVTVDMQQQS